MWTRPASSHLSWESRPYPPTLKLRTLLGIHGLETINQAMVVVGHLMSLGIQHSRLASIVSASCTFKYLFLRWLFHFYQMIW